MPCLAGAVAPEPCPGSPSSPAETLGPCAFRLGGPWGLGGVVATSTLLCAADGLVAGKTGRRAAEEVLAAYAARGERGLAALEGLYRFALWDDRQRWLYLGLDPSGLRPLYHHARAPRFGTHPGLCGPARVDEAGLADFLLFGFPPGGRTLRRHVRAVPPGGLMRWGGERWELLARRTLCFTPPRRGETASMAAGRLAQALVTAVAECTAPTAVVDLPLSGGLDSRALAAAVACLGRPFRTWTLGDPAAADHRLAARVAAALGVPHQALPVGEGDVLFWAARTPALADGLFSAWDGHILHLARRLPADATLVLDGASPLDGFFFAAHLLGARWRRRSFRGSALLRRAAAGGLFDGAGALTMPELFRPPFRRLLQSRLQLWAERLGRDPWTEGRSPLDVHQEQFLSLRIPRYTACGGQLLEGTVTVAHPLFHPAVLAVVLSLPPSRRTAEKRLLAEAIHRLAPALDRIPYERTGLPPRAGALRQLFGHARRRLARRLGWGPTGGAVDYAAWLRRSARLRAHVRDTLFAPPQPLAPWVEAPLLERLLVRAAAEGGEALALLGRLLAVATWCRRAREEPRTEGAHPTLGVVSPA